MSGAACWFWSLMVVACLAWYSIITCLVTYRGIVDIRGMLARLRQDHSGAGDEGREAP